MLGWDGGGGGRDWGSRWQVVAMVGRQIPIKVISQGGGTAIKVCRHLLRASFQGGREGFRCQCFLGRKLGVERPMRQSSLLADLRDADTVDAALPEQPPGRLH